MPGFGIRAAARLIDIVLGWAIGFVAGIIAGILVAFMAAVGAVGPGWESTIESDNNMLLGSLAGILSMISYHTLAEGLGGASVGKLICGLRVITEEGEPCSILAGLIRSVGFLVDGIFFGLVGYQAMSSSPLCQRFGDRWAKTKVVRAEQVPPQSRRRGGLLAIALGVAILIDGTITTGWLLMDWLG